MTKFLVQFDVTRFEEESFENEDGETIYEDYVDEYSDELTVEAEDEEDARTQAYDQLFSYDDVNIWSVEPVED